jgi:CheY-like chemotaxis protein
MPRLNGYEAARAIRQVPGGRGMVLAALTGWGQEADKRMAREAGFDHHFTKPMEANQLEVLLAQSKAGSVPARGAPKARASSDPD